MTDRELLEMAAKAAGYKVVQHAEDGSAWCVPLDKEGFGFWWNPLADDGDALRLAVKLGLVLNLSPRQDGRGQTVVTYHGVCKIEEPCECGNEVAARRAIVRAAAEIGRAMP
jgi:hypothetical protein